MRPTLAFILSGTAGFVLMAFELVATRFMSPLVGSSLYTWSAVIGVILAGLSLGSYVGGRLADLHPSRKMASVLYFGSACAVLLPLLLKNAVSFFVLFPISIPILVTFVAAMLFLVPSTILGTLQPMVVKLQAKELSGLGRTYGILSAMWSLGSIVGVFVTGFVLIPILGTFWSTLLLSGLLLICGAILTFEATYLPIATLAIASFAFLLHFPTGPHQHMVMEKETPNFHAMVSDVDTPTFGHSRILFLDVDTHSITRSAGTVPTYVDFAQLFADEFSGGTKTLFIGAGAYTMPNLFARHSSSSITVVESDPEVPRIAKEYFSIDPSIVTEIADARMFLRRSAKKYDLVVGDAFSSYSSVPWHLLTEEFDQEVNAHLTDRGIYAINIIAARAGDGAKLFESVSRTLSTVFPHMVAYAFGDRPDTPQNILLIASRSDLTSLIETGKSLALFPGTTITPERLHVPLAPPLSAALLTDDHAPTDTELLSITRAYLPFSIALFRRATQ